MNAHAGFTLVEMIVALGIFIFVVTIALGALLSLSTSSQKAQAIRNVTDNLDFAIESMSRNLRVGSNYHCDITISTPPLTSPNDCAANGANSISFLDSVGRQVTYRLNTATASIERSYNGGAYLSMTAPEVQITTLLFYVVGSLPGDGQQPKIIMIVRGNSGLKNTTISTFDLETTITQRLIDS